MKINDEELDELQIVEVKISNYPAMPDKRKALLAEHSLSDPTFFWLNKHAALVTTHVNASRSCCYAKFYLSERQWSYYNLLPSVNILST